MARLTSKHDRAVQRSGVVLLIVMAMLALFAVVGLSFVFYAESEHDGAMWHKVSIAGDNSDITPEKLMSYAMGQLIFGVDPAKNPLSKIGMHNLATSIYGPVGGTVAFNGLGRPHPNSNANLMALTPFDGVNVPYTYPDINNAFLASFDPTNPGWLKDRSFFRNDGSLRPATLLPPLPPGPFGEGDVRNIDSINGVKYYHKNGNFVRDCYNDAFWSDLGFPVMTAKDSTRYKPLFAITVLDLDSRVNLAVTGNYHVTNFNNNNGTSRCGLGAWEINPAHVLTASKAEIPSLFHGNGYGLSRYGSNNNDDPDAQVTFPTTPFYARVDYSGVSQGGPAQPSSPYSQFPVFASWSDLPPNSKHAAGYDYFNRSPANPGGTNDTRLAASNAEALLRWRDRGSAALTSDLFRVLPTNLNPKNPQSQPIMNLVTPLSVSLDTAHIAPFFIDQSAKYTFTAPAQGGAVNSPYPTTSSATSPIIPGSLAQGSSEFSTDFRSRTAAELRRLNLNRSALTTTADKIAMATDIFNRLVVVTGAKAPSPSPPFNPLNKTDPEYKATRWLAQLAVNIVDFMDHDDLMTVFNWNPKPAASLTEDDFVFGVELNRLLINEVYVSVDNDVTEPAPGLLNLLKPHAKYYRINAWAELYNPMKNNLGLRDQGTTNLLSNVPKSGPVYRMLLAKASTGILDSATGMPTDATGKPNLYYAMSKAVTDWSNGNSTSVPPGDGNRPTVGFYLVGPPEKTFLSDRKPTGAFDNFNLHSMGMNSDPQLFPPGVLGNPATFTDIVKTINPTLVLQRLADPTLAQQDDPTKAGYNPYVTVDYFENIPANDSVKFIDDQPHSPGKLGRFASLGRFQPMQATTPKPQSPSPAINPGGQEPQSTFGRQNSKSAAFVLQNNRTETLKAPHFDAYFHLDRPLISTAEAMLAHAVAPSQITQRYPNSDTAYPALADVNSLLSRFLETVTVGDRAYNKYLAANYYADTTRPGSPKIVGTGKPAVLVPGKINLNTVFDLKVLQALFDRQTNSSFSDQDVQHFWNDLLEIRKTRAIAGFSDYTFDPITQKVTLQKTLFDTNKLFQKMTQAQTAVQSEYEKTDGFRKVMNNITFTSNSFAVWVTVGFFEVDSTGNPTREIGLSENRNVRHRMFAIVDRSQLVLPDQQLTVIPAGGQKGRGAAGVTLAAASGNLTAVPGSVKVEFPNWSLRPGMTLTIDKGKVDAAGQSIEEDVMVLTYKGGNTITIAGFQYDHPPNATVHFGGVHGPQVPLNNGTNNFVLGNPGPQPNFNMRDYTYVVPYYSIID